MWSDLHPVTKSEARMVADKSQRRCFIFVFSFLIIKYDVAKISRKSEVGAESGLCSLFVVPFDKLRASVVRCSLFVVCCSLFVVCGLLFWKL